MNTLEGIFSAGKKSPTFELEQKASELQAKIIYADAANRDIYRKELIRVLEKIGLYWISEKNPVKQWKDCASRMIDSSNKVLLSFNQTIES